MINLSLEWKTVELKSIADVTMGQSPKSEFYNDNFEGMPFLQGNKTFGDKYPSFELYTTSIKKVAKKSSVLMSVRAPVGDLNIAREDICIGRGVCGLQMKKGDNEFLYYLCLIFYIFWPSCMILEASQMAQVVKNLPANTGDAREAGSIPGLVRSPRK